MGTAEVITNLHTTDVGRAREFFGLLGLTETTMDQGWVARFSAPESGACVQVVTRDASAPEDSHLTIKVDDVDAAYELLTGRGFEIVHPLTDEPWGIRRFFVRAPDGQVVNIARHRTESPPPSAPPPDPAAGADPGPDVLPTFADVLRAAPAVAAVLPPTPAWSYPLLDDVAGVPVVLKHENTQPTGAFKIRGGLALLANLSPLPAGLVTASTGNHAQSIAFAARRAGIPAIVVMPISAPDNKIAAVRALGAQVVSHGPTMVEAMLRADELATARGYRLVGVDEAAIVAGHATVTLELLRQEPGVRTIYVPAGSGTSAAGACLVRDELAPKCRIVAVQSAQAPAAYGSWVDGAIRTAPCQTRASGLATATGYELPQRILRARLDDFILVDDEDIDAAIALLATTTHTLAEGAGAAALAGLLRDGGREGRCAVIISGGNADARELATLATSRPR